MVRLTGLKDGTEYTVSVACEALPDDTLASLGGWLSPNSRLAAGAGFRFGSPGVTGATGAVQAAAEEGVAAGNPLGQVSGIVFRQSIYERSSRVIWIRCMRHFFSFSRVRMSDDAYVRCRHTDDPSSQMATEVARRRLEEALRKSAIDEGMRVCHPIPSHPIPSHPILSQTISSRRISAHLIV